MLFTYYRAQLLCHISKKENFIIFPIMFATLHLATHNPCMIFYIMPSEKVQSRMKKTIMAILCCILSFLNPVLLLNAYEGAKERMKRLALTMHPNVVQEMKNTKAIKNQWITFIKIELGKSPVQSFYLQF